MQAVRTPIARSVNPQRLLAIGGFAMTALFAVNEGWTLPEFCWSTWLAGLVFAYACLVAGVVEIPLRARATADAIAPHVPRLQRLPHEIVAALTTLAGIAAGYLLFRFYTYIFGFYGLFLSVFAEMEPAGFFGRNGFINSDFFSPAYYLLERFWPMAAGMLLANAPLIASTAPWRRLVLPFSTSQIVRLHFMVLALPFLALLAYALLGEAYHILAIVLLMAVLYLVPAQRRTARKNTGAGPGAG